MKLCKKTLSLLLTLAMLLGMIPAATLVSAEEAAISSWAGLQSRIDNAQENEIITLTQDLTAQSGDARINIPEGKSVILDLNGWTLDRGLGEETTPAVDGQVLYVQGTLTIRDSSESELGRITGGYARNGGGVNNIGTLILESGTITGNRAMHTGNTIEGRGGGIMNYGTFIMTGSSVDNNSGYLGGGVNCSQDTIGHNMYASLTGGTIFGNTADYGGGLYVRDTGNTEIEQYGVHLGGTDIHHYWFSGDIDYGGIEILGNSATQKGGGVYCNSGATFYVQDSPIVSENLNGNVYLAGSSVITSGLNGNGTAQNFFSDTLTYFVRLNSNGEAELWQFTDVPSDAWYHDPVNRAAGEGITAGTTDNSFSPTSACTRAQIVTSLWHAAGSPEPAGTETPFTDVQNPDAWYYKPILWAYENGITSGVSVDAFGVKQVCTRAQVVTFLWRMADSPEPELSESPFNDVQNPDAWYYSAVLWAAENDITAGTSAGRFSPAKTCARAEVVTFLYSCCTGTASEE